MSLFFIRPGRVYRWFRNLPEPRLKMDDRVKRIWIIRRAAISNQHNYCYFRVPKCANSTISRTLAYYDPTLSYRDGDATGSWSKKQFTDLRGAKGFTVGQFLARYYKFTFVRNPYTRLLSAYLDKILGDREKHKFDFVREDIGKARLADVAFSDFVSYLEAHGLYSNPHWAPQLSMLPLAPGELDFVGFVEELENGLETVINAIFGTGTYRNAQVRNQGRTDAQTKTAAYYSPDLAERVYLLYSEDFRQFGYSKTLL